MDGKEKALEITQISDDITEYCLSGVSEKSFVLNYGAFSQF